jgi:hypothetical protein
MADPAVRQGCPKVREGVFRRNVGQGFRAYCQHNCVSLAEHREHARKPSRAGAILQTLIAKPFRIRTQEGREPGEA